jgi:hypothetical protein
MYKCENCGEDLDGIVAISKHDCPKRPVTTLRKVYSVTNSFEKVSQTVLMGADAWEIFNKQMRECSKS